MAKQVAQIEIPKFITKVKTSNARRAKYYKKNKKGWYPRNLPKTFQSKLDKGIYSMKKGYLLNEDGKKVIANGPSVGKPKYETLSGNKLLSGYGSPHIRATLVKGLREFYRPFVQEYIKEHGPIEQFPLIVKWDCYTTVPEDPEQANWDAGNLFFYYKYFEDSLHKDAKDDPKRYLALIPDDDVVYITHPAAPKIIPVDNWNDRKFIFKFYYDDRQELKRGPWV